MKNTDMVIDIDDEDSQRLLRLFNTPEGQAYLKNELHLDDELIEKLTWLGISGIATCCAASRWRNTMSSPSGMWWAPSSLTPPSCTAAASRS